ncbi:head decoration protein [Streptomyces sp. NBC_01435]|uniref:head decoration protein n=1 Tax=Streptomyces sp. NBC_01435 TaxID=2903865 RepID=UPI002E31C416|nr:head decoration protein [Streptomyces sp. NBC_01435]
MNDFQPYSYTDAVTADRPWLASLVGVQDTNTITLDLSKFTKDTHYVVSANPALQGRNVMKSGIPLGKVTASGLYAPYKSSASDGTETLVGFLVSQISFNPTSTKAAGALLWHGEIFPAKTPVPFNPTGVTAAPGVNFHYR